MPYYIFNTDLEIPVEWDFDPEFPMSEYRPFLKGDPVSEADIEKFPKKIIVKNVKEPKNLPEVIANGADLGIVNLEVKEYLEQHDPGLHRFFPIDVQLAGTDYVMEYFFLYSSNKISSVCYEKTRFKKGYGKESAERSVFMPKKDPDEGIECFLYKEYIFPDAVFGEILTTKTHLFISARTNSASSLKDTISAVGRFFPANGKTKGIRRQQWTQH